MSKRLSFFLIKELPVYLVILFAPHATQTALAENNAKPAERLIGKIDYWFVRHLGQTDDAGRALTWEATIDGDVSGQMKWWFVTPSPASPITRAGGRTTFYAARWELWVDEELVLAGETAGKTDFDGGGDGMWDGHGRVTEATGDLESFIGRDVYETGPVMLGSDPPRTLTGTGLFVIY